MVSDTGPILHLTYLEDPAVFGDCGEEAAMTNWAEEMSEEEWAELEADGVAADEAYERGDYIEITEETREAFLAGVRERGRAMLAAERKKAS